MRRNRIEREAREQPPQILPVLLRSAYGIAGLWICLLCFTGCIPTPVIYGKTPEEVAAMRSELGTIGVALSGYEVEPEIPLPATGAAGGAGRGFVVGAATPVAVGMVAPIPFGTLFGLMLAPVGAVAGTAYGAFNGAPADQVEQAQEVIDKTVVRLQILGLDQLRDEVVRLGSERTELTFKPLPGVGPNDPEEIVRYDQQDLAGIDNVLELLVVKAGLLGLYTLDPPQNPFVDVRARLIRVSDNVVLHEDIVQCFNTTRQTYVEWAAADEGQHLYDSVLACFPRLAEKIVDDFFLVYPLASGRG